ncbi:outer membrane protein [Limnohabitans sp. DCL3]|uniref:outer membrane protein n=1 Tax=Limnohabitans sp. DCL3 TaxID=3374103 RepID=UPI003A8940AF
MNGVAQGVLCLLAGLSGAAQAQTVWTGPYGGVGLGAGRAKSSASAALGHDGQTPALGWTANRFRGDVYNAVNSMQAVDYGPPMGMTPTVVSFGPSSEWATQWGAASSGEVAQVFGGVNWQAANWVYGVEARSSFGNFGAGAVQDHAFAATKVGSFTDYEGAAVTLTNYGNALSGVGFSESMDDWQGVAYSMPFTQTGRLASQVKLDGVNAALARVGYAQDQWLLYAVGGVAHARVKLSTQAEITETVTGGTVTGRYMNTVQVGGSKTYSFAGSQSRDRLGPAWGLGLQWQMENGLQLRLEALRQDFGSASVTGVSSQTQATYSIRQRILIDQLTLAVVKRF